MTIAADNTPSIAATADEVFVIGSGFQPDYPVTIRITTGRDDIADYLTYTTDAEGLLHAALPTATASGTLRISATDHRSAAGSDDGLLWSNTCTIALGEA
ncbi:hypothetical protein [Mycobacterium sp. 050134]|uniref:hypothetical protein n=1 Tax=Mycobacterium sp. 050134 TaxID=3096111 RepID=UPI002ED82E90